MVAVSVDVNVMLGVMVRIGAAIGVELAAAGLDSARSRLCPKTFQAPKTTAITASPINA